MIQGCKDEFHGPPVVALNVGLVMHDILEFTTLEIGAGCYHIIPCLLSVCFDDAMHGRYAQFYVNKGIRVTNQNKEDKRHGMAA